MYPSIQNPIAGAFVREQVGVLAKHCDVKVIAPVSYAPPLLRNFKQKWKLFSMIPQHEWIDGIEVFRPRVPMLPRNLSLGIDGFSYFLGVLSEVKRLSKSFSFDIIHAHSLIPDGFGAALIAGIVKKPLVVTIHGRELHGSFKKSRLIEKEIAFSIKRASAVVTVSSVFLKRLMTRFPELPTAKTSVIYNGFDTSTFERRTKEVGRPSCDFTLLTVANLLKLKGHEYVLRALAFVIKEHPEIVYQIIGTGPEKERLKGFCKSLGIENNVFFLGEKSRNEVADYMANCDAFIMTSTDEGFGVVYLEAMSQGKPIIGSLGQGISDIIEDGMHGFLVDPTDVGAIASTITSLIEDAKLRESVGQRGMFLVWSKYTWTQNAEKYMELYEHVLDRKNHAVN